MTIFKLTAESIKTQEDSIRSALSHFCREFPGTYVSLMSANIYLRITEESHQDALVQFYERDFPTLTDLVQDSIERERVGACYPLLDYQRVLLYQRLHEALDEPYSVVKAKFQQLEHMLIVG